jgi:rubredoxin-NAD+ reductase
LILCWDKILLEFLLKIGYNKFKIKEVKLMKYVCDICGYVYDEDLGDADNGIAPGTKWEDLPEDFVCPLCGVGKDSFSQE